MPKIFFPVILAAGLLGIVTTSAIGQVAGTNKASDETWTDLPPTTSYHQQPNARAIVQQKAEIRAQQRMDRLAALNWYGTSNSRPILLGTPFFSSSSDASGDLPHMRPHDYYEAYQLPFTTRVLDR
jgi:hypothetical protein